MQAVLFDLYGTLVDILTDESDLCIYRTISKFLTYFEIHYRPEELAAKYQKKTAEKMLASVQALIDFGRRKLAELAL